MSVLTLAPSPVSQGKRKAVYSPTRAYTQYYVPPRAQQGLSGSDSEYDGFTTATDEDDSWEEEDGPSAGSSIAPAPRQKITRSSSSLLRKPRSKEYTCSHEGCEKVYSKPSRLAEHERSHTGVRPYSCSQCSKSYLRESHLLAHARSHLSAAERPLACPREPCEKRFWTQQHLEAHICKIHDGVKPFKCSVAECSQSFAKNHQLRAHVAASHSPPGTKPFRCEHDNCSKSFATSQKLRAHSKTHQHDRYACGYTSCYQQLDELGGSPSPLYFSTWTDLQNHLRTAHPPTCPYPECNGQTFTAQKGLRAHLKVHEERERENAVNDTETPSQPTLQDPIDENEVRRETKRRRGGEVGRDWECTMQPCNKAFKSKKALTNHVSIGHLGLRPFSCPHPPCNKTFGYKHVLQRHIAQKHVRQSSPIDSASQDDRIESDDAALLTEADEVDEATQTLALLTGQHYHKPHPEYDENGRMIRRAKRTICCPWPNIGDFSIEPRLSSTEVRPRACAFKFSRTYDLRRHLRSEHGVEVERDVLDSWAGKLT